MMSQNTKRTSLILLLAAAVALVLLASSLSNLELQAGAPFPGSDSANPANQSAASTIPVDVYWSPILQGIVSLLVVSATIYVLARLIPLVDIKRILRWLLVIAILLVAAYMIPHTPASPAAALPGESSEGELPAFAYPVSPLGTPPLGLIWLVSISLLLGGGLIAVRFLRGGRHPARIEDQLSQEAELAIHALAAGANLRNVILRCYLQMTRALQEEHGIERSENMTVQEFEDLLAIKGFPSGPVKHLSRLFESVRYGGQQTTEGDEAAALESLHAIVQFCRSKRA
jgi:hypothetical protein